MRLFYGFFTGVGWRGLGRGLFLRLDLAAELFDFSFENHPETGVPSADLMQAFAEFFSPVFGHRSDELAKVDVIWV